MMGRTTWISVGLALAALVVGCGGARETGTGAGGTAGGGGAPSCQDACPADGATACESGSIRTCHVDPSGCLAFGDAAPCAQGSCASAEACDDCAHTCPSVGTTDCTGNQVRTCEADPKGCRSWGPESACSGACAGGQCVLCTAETVASCAAGACASQEAATKSCGVSCGALPSQDCYAKKCAGAYEKLAICLASKCPACDFAGYCDAFCKNTFACGSVSSVAECKSACAINGLLYPAACGSWGECKDLYTCGQIKHNHCADGQFACADGVQCISLVYRCDSTPECADGSDEGGVCAIPPCAAGHRYCDGACAACPSAAGVTGVVCDGAACVVGACDAGSPAKDHCAAIDHTVAAETPSSDYAVRAVGLGDDDSPHVVFDRLASFTPVETLYASRVGGAWTVDVLPLPVGLDVNVQLVVVGAEPHLVAQVFTQPTLHHAWKDAGGWHIEQYPYNGGFAKGAWRASFDPFAQEIVVVDAFEGRFHRKHTAGWATTPFPNGVPTYNFRPSNVVFTADGTAHYAVAGPISSGGQVTGWKAEYCSVGAVSGACTELLSAYKQAEQPVLSLAADGEPRFATAGDAYQTGGPVTVFARTLGIWKGHSTTPIAGVSTFLDTQALTLTGPDAANPIGAFVAGPTLVIGRWTGTAWLQASIAPDAGRNFAYGLVNRGFEVAANANGWLLATATAPAGGTGARVEVYRAGL